MRFWACYAVSQLDLRFAAAHLRQLVDDQAVAIMGWTVGYEAIEAVKVLNGFEGWTDDRPIMPSSYAQLW